jgi:dTDP-4-dehydrorhamnose 3,5-epimerase
LIFKPMHIPGAYVIGVQKNEDQRGFFARGWCRGEFEARGLPGQLTQLNISYNRRKHTLRGFHFQAPPHAEDKLIRCTHGAMYGVVLDLRPGSATHKRHASALLSRANGDMLVVPKGCASAFLTLEDDTDVIYLMSEPHQPASARGVRWNDPAFNVAWPVSTPAVISDRDESWPDYRDG